MTNKTYIVTEQTKVEATSPREAIANSISGTSFSITATEQLQAMPAQRQVVPVAGAKQQKPA